MGAALSRYRFDGGHPPRDGAADVPDWSPIAAGQADEGRQRLRGSAVVIGLMKRSATHHQGRSSPPCLSDSFRPVVWDS